MSSRTRRQQEIAKANEPAFLGDQWWLAEAPPKPESPVPPAAAAPAPQPDPVPVAAGSAREAGGIESVSLAESLPETLPDSVLSAFPANDLALHGAVAAPASQVPVAVIESTAPQPAASAVPTSFSIPPGPQTEAQAPASPVRVNPNFPRRVGGLRDKFLGLGRKKRW